MFIQYWSENSDLFEFETSARVVAISCPDASQVQLLDRALSYIDKLRAVCGVQFEAVWAACRSESFSVIVSLTDDLLSHFHLNCEPPTGWVSLIKLLDSHGPAIEYDLRHELGVDLRDYIVGERPWAQLHRFLERLPRHSHFHASVMGDADSVAEMLNRPTSADTSFGTLDWTHERELLTLIVDVLNQLHATIIQVNSDKGKRPAIDPMPRPVTVLNKVETQQNMAAHQERVRKFLPRG